MSRDYSSETVKTALRDVGLEVGEEQAFELGSCMERLRTNLGDAACAVAHSLYVARELGMDDVEGRAVEFLCDHRGMDMEILGEYVRVSRVHGRVVFTDERVRSARAFVGNRSLSGSLYRERLRNFLNGSA